MNFIPERLTSAREELGINKAEAARRLNMSAMGYGRYEKGDRIPSFQTISFIAQKFNTSVAYLCGESIESDIKSITITYNDNPDMYELVKILLDGPERTPKALLELLIALKKDRGQYYEKKS